MMCRLLGVIANKSVDLEFSLERFKEFARQNSDGWGIGWYEEEEAEIFRQGISAVKKESQLPILSKEVRSRIIIAHVRKASDKQQAPPAERNSHPFKYRNWIFAHNGSVDKDYLKSRLAEQYKSELKGETDSEVYFYWLLQCIEKERDVVKGIKKAIDMVVKRKHSGLNFLFSDGNSLHAFRYSSHYRDYYSLHKLKRFPSEVGPIEFLSKETKSIIYSKSLKGEEAVLVCSEELTKEEKWEKIGFGNLLIIKADLAMEEVNIL